MAEPITDPGPNVATDSWQSPLLARPGAVPAQAPDAGVAWHYGDPLREQRSLRQGQALVDLSHRGVVRVGGPDRLVWLHSLTTAHLTDLQPGVSTEALVLSPHGHIEHDLHLRDDGDAVWITVEPGTAPALVGWLNSMQFMRDVQVSDETAAWAVLADWAPGVEPAAELAGQLPGDWRDPWPDVAEGSVSYSGEGPHPGQGWALRERLVPREQLDQAVGEQALAGIWALEALRIAAARPRAGIDTDHRTIAHELDWLRTAVHLQKGCYRGQETIARVHNLGRPPRRIVLLHLDGSQVDIPSSGDPVELAGRTIGRVTSVARHYELGPIALAVIKRNTPVDAVLQIGEITASQETLVLPT